jgi:hypothetical protein
LANNWSVKSIRLKASTWGLMHFQNENIGQLNIFEKNQSFDVLKTLQGGF